MHLTFEGESLGHILTKMRTFLADLPGDGAVQGLVNLDEPLPPAVKRASKERGAPPTREQVEAVFQAEAPPCTREEVAASARAYLAAFGRTAAELAPEEKNAVSHRGRALAALVAQLKAMRNAER